MSSNNASDSKIEFNKNLKGFYCNRPFTSLELHLNQQAYVCCPSWMKKSIGNFNEENLSDIWNSSSAQEIRSSIIDGSYRFCDQSACPYIQAHQLPKFRKLNSTLKAIIKNKTTKLNSMPENVMFTFDPSCNLSCPSCRAEKISYGADSILHKASTLLTEKVSRDLLKNPNQYQRINITGSGDPFASLAYRQFLESVDGRKHSQLVIDLQTNGLLFTPIMWERMEKIQNNIGEVCVSIDAATEETYVQIRRLGSWQVIKNNMLFLSELRKKNKFKTLQVNFVVQQKNYREIPAFAEMFINTSCDVIYYSLINDWGSMSKEEYFKNQIWSADHPDYNHFINVLEHPILSHKKINLGTLTPYRKLALKRRIKTLPLHWRLIENLKFKLLQSLGGHV